MCLKTDCERKYGDIGERVFMKTVIPSLENVKEIEILEFMVGKNHYGIEVDKISEISLHSKPTFIPNAHPWIEGIFVLRDQVIVSLDMFQCLDADETEKEENEKEEKETDMNIITRINDSNLALHVSTVKGMHKVLKENILEPDESIRASGNGFASGVINLNDRIIILLDFVNILSNISST